MKIKNDDNLILYITYTDMKNASSGSSVRPIQMYNAFLSKKCNVKLLCGLASRELKEDRIKNIKNIEEWLDKNNPKFCYIESPGDPIIFKEDRNLIKKIHRKNIRIGYFYRDAYYKLSKNYIFSNKKVGLKQYIKYLYYKFLYWRDEQLLKKYVDIVYFPSVTMAKYFNFKDKRTLPPAGKKVIYNRKNAKSLIYVGGVSERYGTNYMLEAMELVNQRQHIDLILVCRQKEINNIDKKYLDKKWLKIYNVSGHEKLKPLYEKSKFALFPLKKDLYNDFAVSVKIFEYMSYGLPIVANDTIETTKIINKYGIGIVTSQNFKQYSEAILKLYNDEKLLNELFNNVQKALEVNLWTNRVEQIIDEMTNDYN